MVVRTSVIHSRVMSLVQGFEQESIRNFEEALYFAFLVKHCGFCEGCFRKMHSDRTLN